MKTCTICSKRQEELYEITDNKKSHSLCISCFGNNYDAIKENVLNPNWRLCDRSRRAVANKRRFDQELLEKKAEEKREKIEKIEKEKQQEKQQALNTAFAGLNKLVGMNHVKKELRDWVDMQKGKEKLQAKTKIKLKKPMMHMFITGSPGTGKTVLAKEIAKVLHIAGLIPNNTFISCSTSELIGQHVGHTTPLTNKKIAQAMGGVLFIDEAYKLASDGAFRSGSTSGSYGREALEAIMEAMEVHAGKIVFIFAGYADKMPALLAMNEGMESRITQHFHLPDYTPEELLLIAETMLEEQGLLLTHSKETLSKALLAKVDNGVLQGNARTIRTMSEKIIMKHSIRISKEEEDKDLLEIAPEDILNALVHTTTLDERESLETLYKDAMAELHRMIGLQTVKNQMEKIGKNQMIQRRRKEQGLKCKKMTNHMFFTGAPGTGKTTVARIVGKIFRGAGVLSNGHLVEVTKDDLTGGSQPTTTLVKNIINKAKGGVLFLDEAYALTNDRQGKEAVDALIREMEEHREDLIVIFAGYEKDMEKLLSLNPGFMSRVPHHITFPNYNASELLDIAFNLVKTEEYVLSADAKLVLYEKVNEFYENGSTESNGRWVRNLIDKLVLTQSERTFDNDSDDLMTIKELDVHDVFCELEYAFEKTAAKQSEESFNPTNFRDVMEAMIEKIS